MAPLLQFFDKFETSFTFGDVVVPIHVKRLSRAEVDAMQQAWAALMVAPNGAATDPGGAPCAKCGASTNEQAQARRLEEFNERTNKDRLVFCEQTIRECITLDEGLIEDRGKPVTDGAGMLDAFHARKDVLQALAREVYMQNLLIGVFAKNSNSLRVSDTGSAASAAPARSGNSQVPTAASAESASSAPAAAVTDASAEASGDESNSSGKTKASGSSQVH